MKYSFCKTLVGLFLVSLLQIVFSLHAVAVEYTITDLGTLAGHDRSGAYDINNLAQVVGFSDPDPYHGRGFLWEDGQMSDLGSLSDFSGAAAINKSGWVVGLTDVPNQYFPHACLWKEGAIAELIEYTSHAHGINSSGQIVGDHYPQGKVCAFLIEDPSQGPFDGIKKVKDLGTLGGSYASALDINDTGQVVGYSSDADDLPVYAFIWENGQMKKVCEMEGQASAINDSGQVVGWYYDGSTYQAFLWANGAWSSIHDSSFGWSQAEDINQLGQVVGSTGSGAFIWDPVNGMQKLEDMVPNLEGWIAQIALYSASGINDKGEIVGQGLTSDGEYHAFLLTPLPTNFCPDSAHINIYNLIFGSNGSSANYGFELFIYFSEEISVEEMILTVKNNSGETSTLPVTIGSTQWEDGSYCINATGRFSKDESAVPILGKYSVSVNGGEPYFIGELEDIPGGAPEMVYPESGATISDTDPTFKWEEFTSMETKPWAYQIDLEFPDGNTYTVFPIPGDITSLEYSTATWDPVIPEKLDEGQYTLTLHSNHLVNEAFNFEHHRTMNFNIVETIEIMIDIKPGSCDNPFNVKSKGVLPVAILGSSDFDVTAVDPTLISLAGVAPIRSNVEDVVTPDDCTDGNDGYLDLTLKFRTQEIVQALDIGQVNDGDIMILELTGNLKEEFGGTSIRGEDVVKILKR